MSTDDGETTESDSWLLQRFLRNGDEEALERLVRRYHGLVLGVCSRVLRHRQWAEDAYQSTFQVLLEQAGSIRRQEVLASWLYGVAYRIARRVQRREARRMSCELLADVPLDDDPLERLCRDHDSELLDDELARLPASLRQPLILRYQLNLSNLEVARRLKLSVAAVEGRLKRARALLRYRLARQGVALSVMLGILTASQQTMAEPLSAPGTPGSELVRNVVQLAVQRQAARGIGQGKLGKKGGEWKGYSPEVRQLVEQEIWQMAIRKTLAWTGATIVAASLGFVVVSWPVLGQAEGGGGGGSPAANTVEVAMPTGSSAEGSGSSGVVNAQVGVGSLGASGSAIRATEESDPFSTGSMGSGGSGAGSPAPPAPEKLDISRRTPGEQRLFDAMADISSLHFTDAPLGVVLEQLLQEQHTLQFVVDRAGLESEGASLETPVSVNLEGVSLRAGLKHLLEPLQLAAIIEDEVVRITTRHVADETFDVRLYRLPSPWQGKPLNQDSEKLLTDLVLLAAPEDLAEQETGIVPVRLVPIGGDESALVVRATSAVHDRVMSVLRKLD